MFGKLSLVTSSASLQGKVIRIQKKSVLIWRSVSDGRKPAVQRVYHS